MRPKPVVLLILDGWGIAPPSDMNAIARAKTPVMNRLITTYPAMTLAAASTEVGLNTGEVGNSEVGHLNIGAGRVYYQTLPRINKAISDRSFFSNPVFLKACATVRKNKSRLHLMGLVSPGGVHAHQDHLYALLELAKEQRVKDAFIHAFLDGRDTIYNARGVKADISFSLSVSHFFLLIVKEPSYSHLLIFHELCQSKKGHQKKAREPFHKLR